MNLAPQSKFLALQLVEVKSGNPLHFLHSAPLQFGALEFQLDALEFLPHVSV